MLVQGMDIFRNEMKFARLWALATMLFILCRRKERSLDHAVSSATFLPNIILIGIYFTLLS